MNEMMVRKTCEVAQQVKVIATKPDDLSLILRTQFAEGET